MQRERRPGTVEEVKLESERGKEGEGDSVIRIRYGWGISSFYRLYIFLRRL